MDLTDLIVWTFAVLTVAGQILALALLVALASGGRSALAERVREHGLVLMLAVAVLGTGGSLYLSDVAGWTPCKLCWIQRIFLYPQVVLLGIAIWRRDKTVAWHILALSVIGLLFAKLHYGEQVWAALHPADPSVPCDASGTSCASTPFFRFGYITIPMMAATAFALNMLGSVLLLAGKRQRS